MGASAARCARFPPTVPRCRIPARTVVGAISVISRGWLPLGLGQSLHPDGETRLAPRKRKELPAGLFEILPRGSRRVRLLSDVQRGMCDYLNADRSISAV